MAHVDPIPPGMRTVTPHLICADASAAIAFYEKAFGAQELSRLPAPNGKLMHAQLRIGDSMVMLVDESAEWGALGPKARGGTSVTIHLSVMDADADFARAVTAGATAVYPIEDTFWGARYGIVEDPFGHRWSIATQKREMDHEEMKTAVEAMFK